MFNLKPMFNALLLTLGIALATSFNASAINQNNKNKLPDIGISAYSVLSIDKELQIGQAMMRQLRASQPLIQDPVLIEYINHLGNSLVKNAQGVNYAFEFFLVNNKELNAFAFFGGHVGIHSGLITTADTESELASVIAHEISHVTQRHLARRLESQSQTQTLSMAAMLSSVLITLVNPTVGMAALSASMAASQQASINYTRGNEKEADRVGIALLATSGFDPQGAASFFSKMSAKYRYASKPPAMLLTHPMPESRITDARQRALNYPARPIPPSLGFELTKARLKSRYQGDAKSNISYFKLQLSKKRYALKAAAQYGLALSYFEDKQIDQAQQLLEELKQADKNNLFYVDALTDVYIANNQTPKAIKMLEQLNLFMPNNQVVSLNYANALLKVKNYDLAAQILHDFLLVNPGNFIAYDILTTLYRSQGKMGLMHMNKAEVYALLGGYSKAVDELQTSYTFLDKQPLMQKRIKARILQFQEQENRLKRL
ncbi:M48 family metalloprotease [Colwellia psychrerythraea]|uniref:Putative beta-barrel assembly-enhancing protease n=1 Tax=Colwellia psychrerythraea TaxID=28229 RepID=A0A099KCR2_COLPS|nr:M48 family metalloprotease [Colwellia psychrerythraea]KGJ87383.1 peptidase M48 Ste24p [Colwellia psychrerythraea]